MVAVVDIGNTNVHVGLYKDEELSKYITYPTQKKYIENKIATLVANRTNKKLEGIVLVSVIPRLTTKFVKSFKKNLNISPLIISSKLNCNLIFKYYNPKTLGADRISNVVGGLARYKKNLIVIDFGTATTFDVVLKNGYYLGGLIMPGIGTSLEMLSVKTALLPKVKLKKSISTIGRSTEECIRSGVFNGTVAMVKGLIREIKKEKGKNFLCIATGGWGSVVSSKIEEIKHFDSDLCVYGSLKIYYYNVR